MGRRRFLTGAGATFVAVIGGEVRFAHAAIDETDELAFEPWTNWQSASPQTPLALVRAAILASNAFNTQPWLFRVGADKIEVFADETRNIGAFDPYRRELHFSIGCALENLTIAAAPNGFQPRVSLTSGPLVADSTLSPVLVATVDLAPSPRAGDELYEAIPHRSTNRNLFHPDRQIPTAVLDDFRSLGAEREVRLFLFTSAEQRNALADLIVRATDATMAHEAVRQASRAWLRQTPSELTVHRDGVLLPTLERALPPYLEALQSGRAFGLIAVRDRYDRAQTVRAGCWWQRAHLLATARGLAARPANGVVELIDLERAAGAPAEAAASLVAFTGDARWQPTFMFYMGYAQAPASMSARRDIRQVLLQQPASP